MEFVQIVGWCALGYLAYRIAQYWREGMRDVQAIDATWFKEHEYREGQRGDWRRG